MRRSEHFFLKMYLVLSLSVVPALGQSLTRKFEGLAKTCSHFSLTVVVSQRPLRLWQVAPYGQHSDNPLAVEQLRLLNDLREASHHLEALKQLLKDPDPKVRTLALGAIFQREDGRDLPLIAALIDDGGATFKGLHEPMFSQMPTPERLPEMENPQIVGEVAQEMLAYWGVLHGDHPTGGGYGRPGVTAQDFAGYWKGHEGQSRCASWFAVRMKRATRETTAIQPEYRPEIDRLLAEMKALPEPERSLTEVYVLAPDGWFEYNPDDYVVAESYVIAEAKLLGPETLLRFLQRKWVSDDPDLQMYERGNGTGNVWRETTFMQMSRFILRYADQMLRPSDSAALLACQDAERNRGGVDLAWVIGAALLDPAGADKILRNAMTGGVRGEQVPNLAGTLWRIRGRAEVPFLVDWFYSVTPVKSEIQSARAGFLFEVRYHAAERDLHSLFAALVSDPRFDGTDWETLKEMVEMTNAHRAAPLVDRGTIYAAWPNSMPHNEAILASWRGLLRREYGPVKHS